MYVLDIYDVNEIIKSVLRSTDFVSVLRSTNFGGRVNEHVSWARAQLVLDTKPRQRADIIQALARIPEPVIQASELWRPGVYKTKRESEIEVVRKTQCFVYFIDDYGHKIKKRSNLSSCFAIEDSLWDVVFPQDRI